MLTTFIKKGGIKKLENTIISTTTYIVSIVALFWYTLWVYRKKDPHDSKTRAVIYVATIYLGILAVLSIKQHWEFSRVVYAVILYLVYIHTAVFIVPNKEEKDVTRDNL